MIQFVDLIQGGEYNSITEELGGPSNFNPWSWEGKRGEWRGLQLKRTAMNARFSQQVFSWTARIPAENLKNKKKKQENKISLSNKSALIAHEGTMVSVVKCKINLIGAKSFIVVENEAKGREVGFVLRLILFSKGIEWNAFENK